MSTPNSPLPFLQTITDPEANRNPVLQALIRSYQDSSLKANVDPYQQVDDELQGISPGRKFLANLVRGFAAGATNSPFQSLRESLVEREINKQALAQGQQDSSLLRIQQLLGQQAQTQNTAIRADTQVATTEMREGAASARADNRLDFDREALAQKRDLALQDMGIDQQRIDEIKRHNQVDEGVSIRSIAAKELMDKFKREHPPAEKSDGLTMNQKARLELSLSGGYDRTIKGVKNIISQYNRIASAYKEQPKDKSGVGDINMIYGYVKVLDDISAVKEGETALVTSAMGLADKIRYYYENKSEGDKLSPAVRADMVRQAEAIVDSFKTSVQQDRESYLNMSKQYGLSTDLLIDPFDRKAPSPLGEESGGVFTFDPTTGEFK